jgi:branched-chain amino acid aminotransferase
VVERPFTIAQVCEAASEGRVMEAFGTGTACVLCPIEGIHYRGSDYIIPTGAGQVRLSPDCRKF